MKFVNTVAIVIEAGRQDWKLKIQSLLSREVGHMEVKSSLGNERGRERG
jgi:hypothetical protein